MKDILWILVIILAAVSQWYIIERKGRTPNHLLWFVIRAVVFTGFLVWYLLSGYMWYWAAYYMVMTFAWLFPLLLNIFRGKPVVYMSSNGSVFDKIVIRTIGPSIYWWLGLTLMIIAVSVQIAYGTIPFSEI